MTIGYKKDTSVDGQIKCTHKYKYKLIESDMWNMYVVGIMYYNVCLFVAASLSVPPAL